MGKLGHTNTLHSDNVARTETDPVTGGSTFAGATSSLKLASGLTDLSGGVGGAFVPKTSSITTPGPLLDVFRVVSDTHPDSPAKVAVSPGSIWVGGGQTFYDPTMYVGFFNEASSPSHGIIMEQDYWFDSGGGVFKHKSELHHVFITAAGVQRRPLSWTGQYDTGFIDFSISTDQMQIADPTSGTVYFQFLPTNSSICFGLSGSLVRASLGPFGQLLTGGSIAYSTTNSRYEALAYNPAGVVAGEGVIDFYAALAQTTGSVQTRKGGITGSGNFDVVGNLKAGGKIVFGSNLLEFVQNGYAIQANGHFIVPSGNVSAFGTGVDANITLNLTTNGNAIKGIRIAPFSGSQTADLFSTVSNGGVAKFSVLAGGTPITEDATQGLILMSANAHYWRLTVSNAGAAVFADLGTTRPTV